MGPVVRVGGEETDSPPGEHCHSSNTPPHHSGYYTASSQGNLHSVVAQKYQVEEAVEEHPAVTAKSPWTTFSATVPGRELVQQEKDPSFSDRDSERAPTVSMESALRSDALFLSQGLKGLKPLRPGGHNVRGLCRRVPGFVSFGVIRASPGPSTWNHRPSSEDADSRLRKARWEGRGLL